MAAYLSLLRGINVGGRNWLPRGVLCQMYGTLGVSGIATYVQSGNVVFDGDAGEARALPGRIETLIVSSPR